jgi:hypothetical protein
MMGELQASQGDFAAAIAALQESIDILRHIQSYQVSAVEAILEQVIQLQAANESP